MYNSNINKISGCFKMIYLICNIILCHSTQISALIEYIRYMELKPLSPLNAIGIVINFEKPFFFLFK